MQASIQQGRTTKKIFHFSDERWTIFVLNLKGITFYTYETVNVNFTSSLNNGN
jgi:hypothetical protein